MRRRSSKPVHCHQSSRSLSNLKSNDMNVDKVMYIIASTYDGGGLEQEVFYSRHKANKHLTMLFEDEYGLNKPDPDDDPLEVVADYYDWVREENDNMCRVDVTVAVIEYTGHVQEAN